MEFFTSFSFPSFFASFLHPLACVCLLCFWLFWASAHYWLLCFLFWQSYFIKLFDAGIQCESIRTFIYNSTWIIYKNWFSIAIAAFGSLIMEKKNIVIASSFHRNCCKGTLVLVCVLSFAYYNMKQHANPPHLLAPPKTCCLQSR